jgi:threonine dehydrogenase-like Zn-dependent dehydrogenase
MATKEMMRAVIFKGPYKIAVEERPVPKIQDPQDIIAKVGYTALCGRYVGYPNIKLRVAKCG